MRQVIRPINPGALSSDDVSRQHLSHEHTSSEQTQSASFEEVIGINGAALVAHRSLQRSAGEG